MSRRIAVNLAFFGVIGVALFFWAVTNVISLDLIDHPYEVKAEFVTSPGLGPRYEVTYLGQRIGSIRSVTLLADHVEVAMRIDHDVRVPAGVTAAVRRKSAVGEPYIDLSPIPGRAPTAGARLAKGDVIPIDRTSTPLAYSTLFTAVDDLLRAVDPKALSSLIHELAVGLDGRGDSLRRIVTSGGQVAGDLAANADLLDKVLGDLTTLTHTLAAHAGSIGTGTDDLATLTQTLAASQQQIDALLADGPGLATQLADVLNASADSLGCTLDGLGTLGTRLDAPTIASLSRLISLAPQFAYVLRGLTSPSQGVGGGLFFNNGQGEHVPVYPQQVPAPEVPAIPACGATALPTTSPTATASTATGDQATPPSPSVASGAAPPTSATGSAAPAPERSSTKPASTGGLLPVPGWLVLLLVLVASAGGWWYRGRRRADQTAPDA